MSKSRVLWTKIAGALLVVFASGMVWAVQRRPSDLERKSILIGNVMSYGSAMRVTNCSWGWISDHEIAVVRQRDMFVPKGERGTISGTRVTVIDVNSPRPLLKDFPTISSVPVGERQLDPEMHKRMAALETKYRMLFPGPISPDGKRILWRVNRSNEVNEYLCTKLDGTSSVLYVTPRPPFDTHPLWKPDSKSWVLYAYLGSDGHKLFEVEATTGREVRNVTFTDPAVGGYPVGFSPKGRLLVCGQAGGIDTDRWVTVDTKRPKSAPKTTRIQLSTKGRVVRTAYSTASDRMAFVIEYFGSVRDSRLREIWTCRGDGSELSLLVVRKDTPKLAPPMGGDSLAWSPDGNQLAYTYGTELYLVRVE